MDEVKRCSRCERELPVTCFQSNGAMEDGLQDWCRECKAQVSARLHRKRKLAGVCHCGRKIRPGFKTCATCQERVRQWGRDNPEQKLASQAATHKKNRETIFARYGRVCCCCGEAREEFLTLDHVKGGGNKHRKEIGRTGNTFCGWLIRQGLPDGYQTQCYNCNRSRGHFGYCPHEREREQKLAVA